MVRRLRPAGPIVVAIVLASVSPRAQEPSLAEVIERASKYVTAYQEELAGIVLEEHSQQDMRLIPGAREARRIGTSAHRELRSDVLLVKGVGSDRWLQFRDVFEVDRKPVRDRDERLQQLFLKPSPTTMAQAERIALESARYNLGNVERTVNLPVLALIVLDPAFRSRFEFKPIRPGNLRPFAGIVKSDRDVWAVEYKEVKPGTLIRTTGNKDMPARGRFWIDAPTGRVLRSVLIVVSAAVSANVDVTYRVEPGLGFLVPAEMREDYQNFERETQIQGRATYGKFRRFSVTTETDVKKPPGGGHFLP